MGTVLILIGIAGFCIAMTAKNWNFKNISTVKLVTNTWDIREDFHSISIDSDTETIRFVPSDHGTCRIEFLEEEKVKHTAEVKNGVLNITSTDTRNWTDRSAVFSTESPAITLYLPAGGYQALTISETTGDVELPKDFSFESIDIHASTGDVDCYASASGHLQIRLNTGDIQLGQVSAKDVTLKVSTGHVDVSDLQCSGHLDLTVSTGRSELRDISCGSFSTDGDTGDITMKNLIAEEKISIERSTGRVKFEGCDAGELFITTDTGDVSGSLLSDKVFITKSDTGHVDVPKTITGGRCEITTDTGDIRITVD